jgi:predicted Zn-dependent protease
MRGEKEIQALLEGILARSTADQTEVIFAGRESYLTRFANSSIHQNVAERNDEVRVRVVQGKRIGVASTNDLSDAGLDTVVESALEIARFQPEQPDFESLPEPQPIKPVNAFSEETASFTAEDRAQAVGTICEKAEEKSLVASGAFSTSSNERAVANSLGIFAYHPYTHADLVTVIMGDDSSGYAQATDWEVDLIDAEALGQEAVNKAHLGHSPMSIEAGAYTVILEEYAMATIIQYLSYIGFGALAYQEGRSFMCGRLGTAIADPRLNIYDYGRSPYSLPRPFDFEGVPKQRVELISSGLANAVVYDSYTAQKEGKQSTGHALPAPNDMGPIATNLIMKPGKDSKQAMLDRTERGLWVTRLHYVNPVDRKKAILTGMTRDGTFLIEDGEIVGPVKNLRFTQNMLDMFKNIDMIGKSTALIGSTRASPLKVRDFHFTGVTEF